MAKNLGYNQLLQDEDMENGYQVESLDETTEDEGEDRNDPQMDLTLDQVKFPKRENGMSLDEQLKDMGLTLDGNQVKFPKRENGVSLDEYSADERQMELRKMENGMSLENLKFENKFQKGSNPEVVQMEKELSLEDIKIEEKLHEGTIVKESSMEKLQVENVLKEEPNFTQEELKTQDKIQEEIKETDSRLEDVKMENSKTQNENHKTETDSTQENVQMQADLRLNDNSQKDEIEQTDSTPQEEDEMQADLTLKDNSKKDEMKTGLTSEDNSKKDKIEDEQIAEDTQRQPEINIEIVENNNERNSLDLNEVQGSVNGLVTNTALETDKTKMSQPQNGNDDTLPEQKPNNHYTPIHYQSKHKVKPVHYFAQDWPENMKISKEAFEEYASQVEKEDFEDDIRSLSSSLHQLVGARRDTIKKLRTSADYLDSVWLRCRISKGLGTSASVVGGSLTIAGGVLTLATAGLASPLLIAGIATSSVGAATNIGTSLVEKVINSKQVREMGDALSRDKELTLKIENQIEKMRRYKDSNHADSLLTHVEKLLGKDHIINVILGSVFDREIQGVNGISSKFISDSVHEAISQGHLKMREVSAGILVSEENQTGVITNNGQLSDTGKVLAAAAASTTGAAATTAALKSSGKNVTKESIKYNPLSPDVFLETGKVVGSNSTRLAGQVIVGVSAAFLVWDAIDLGWTVADLIRKKGSNAGKILVEKADELENALKETTENFSVEMIWD